MITRITAASVAAITQLWASNRSLRTILAAGALTLPSFATASYVGGGYADAGIVGEYYANNNLSGTPAFTRRDVRLDFEPETQRSWAGSRTYHMANYPSENFSIRWTGTVLARFDETYTYRTYADDGARLYIKPEGTSTWTQLINNWPSGGQAPTWASGTYTMIAGERYDIRVEYRNLAGNGVLRVLWSSPSTPEEVITPATALSTNHTDSDALWADAIKASRSEWGYNPGVDADGWPLGDTLVHVSEQLAPHDIIPLETGYMTLTLKGYAQIARHGNFEIISQSYDAGTNTTTAIIQGIDKNSNVAALFFNNTDRDGQPGGLAGFTDLTMMRLPYANAPQALPAGTIFNPDMIDAYSNFTVVRFQRNNDQARLWSERCLPGYPFHHITNPFYYNDRYGSDHRGNTSLSHEHEIMLCNEIGSDYFISTPHLATYSGAGNYIRQLALLIRYGSDQNGTPYTSHQANPYYPPLNPNLHVYVEVGNELWNWANLAAYPCFFDLHEEVIDLYNANDPDFDILNYDNISTGLDANGRPYQHYTLVRRWWALRLMHISNEFRAIFGDAKMPGNGNRDPRIRPFFTWQYGDTNATASTGLNFMNNYFNNADGNHVANPLPPNHFFWCGGGAGYYSVTNKDGIVDPNPVPNYSFETPAVSSHAVNPSGANWSFSGTAGIASAASRTPVITSASASSPNNSVGGWKGLKFTTGSTAKTVYELGRWIVSGNSGGHDIRLIRASDGVQVAAANVNASGATPGGFLYAKCAPVTLAANTTYYLLSNESAGGDSYGSAASTVTPVSGFTINGAATGTLGGTWSFVDEGTVNRSFGPLNLKTRDPIYLASGSPLNQPDPVEGTQMAWLQSTNGSTSSIEVSFNLPSGQSDDTYAFNLRWMNRHKELASQSDQMIFNVYAITGGQTTDITPRESQTQPQSWRADWRRVAWWTGNYFWTNVFHAGDGASVTLRIETNVSAGDMVAFVDEIILASVDAFYSDSSLSAGTAAGQPSTGYATNQFRDGYWCAAYGLEQMTYEHGFSAGGDAGNSALQNYCKFISQDARQTVWDAMDAFHRGGGRTPTFGTYSTWCAWEPLNGQRVYGQGDTESYPLMQGMLDVLARLPEEPTNGSTIPAVIPGNEYTAYCEGASNGAPLQLGDWYTYNVVVSEPTTFSLGALLTGGGGYEISIDGGNTIVSSGNANGLVGATVSLGWGMHAIRIRGTNSTNVTVQQVYLDSATQAPTAPATVTASINPNNSVTINWTDSSSGSGQELWFELQRSNTPDFSSGVVDLGTYAAGSTSFTEVTQFPVFTTLYYRIRAVNLVGTSTWSTPSSGLAFPVPPPTNTLWVYDSLDASVGPLDGAVSGFGWHQDWYVQSADTTIPGWEIRNTTPLTYPNLVSTPNYATGGRAYLSAGRIMDFSALPYYFKRTDGQIGAHGTTVWVSALIRADGETTSNGIAQLSKADYPQSGNERLCGIQISNGNWALMVRDASNNVVVTATNKPVVSGETVLMIMKLEFGPVSTVSLYLNPTQLGGSAPAVPHASSTTGVDLRFKTFCFGPGVPPDSGCVDEIRVGDTFAAVTPPIIPVDTTPEILTTSLPGGRQGDAYNASVSVDGGEAPLSWSLSNAPGWLSIDQNGNLSGTPTAAGTVNFTVNVSDNDNDTDNQALSIVVDPDSLPSITTASLPDAIEGQYYSAAISVSGGDGTLTWSLSSAPAWLNIDQNGTLYGTPGSTGSYSVTVDVTDNDNDTDSQMLTINVNAQSGNGLNRDYWTSIGGSTTASLTSLSTYPGSPNGSDLLVNGFNAVGWAGSAAPGSPDWGNLYGERIYGYLVPEVTGTYTFWTAGDNDVDLYLSTDSNPANATRIAYVSGWTPYQVWNVSTTQKSVAITLSAGQAYYIEAVHKESGGSDSCSVAWSKPGESTSAPSEIIPATVLYPFSGGVPNVEFWSGQDIGSVGQAGSFSFDAQTDTFTIEGSGADIWNTSDGFHYVTLSSGLTGDGAIQARIVSIENTNAWAKAGVMLRDSLASGSMQASTVVTPQNVLIFQRRVLTNGNTNSSSGSATSPVWLRIERAGNVFTSKYSTDGQNWTTINAASISMGATIEVGLCVTAHDTSTLCTAVIDNVTVE